MADDYDLIVVGLGAMGSAALYHAARAGLNVLGIDQHDPPHSQGSSHAESRITRLAVGEGPQYLPFVARSHEIWRDLEQRSGEQLLHQSGGYIIAPSSPTEDDRWGGFVHRTAAIADRAGIGFDLRTPAQVMADAPAIKLQGNEAIGYEPTAGIVMCERAIGTQLRLAEAAGATIVRNTAVTKVESATDHERVETAQQRYRSSKVIMATGPWFKELAPAADAHAVTVTRQVVYWFHVDDVDAFSVHNFAFVMWPGHTIDEYSAAFPIAPGARPALKLLGEQFHTATSPAQVDRTVRQREIDDFYERLVEPRLRGVRATVADSSVCLYTNTSDDHFLIDSHPDSPNIWLMSPCSGHGFKHSTALGEAMVAELFGLGNALDLSPFRRVAP